MWMTGFDVPSCSAIYLDKPMKNHTLMQTIARVNRVFGENKVVGLIVDYIGVLNNLNQALAIYAAPVGEGRVDTPIIEKSELVEQRVYITYRFLTEFLLCVSILFSPFTTPPKVIGPQAGTS